ncbi:hypothetical protein B296_00047912 [Ensete ventricosum]|uniref:Uncharacterized protein n=1 Tax=Ensete ventricosum TaxID=4639 RepID=A0A426YDB7_ENSVE|nr:hypothetical protein B296_00047912 [Ensete ventricosum]
MRRHMSTVLRKNTTVIYIAQIRVSFGFSRTVLEFQNTGNSQHISPWGVIQAWFREKT